MIVLYSSPGCASCRKMKQWLKDKNLDYVEKNIFKVMLSPEEIKYLLMRSDNGTDDIISKRSKVILQNKIDVDEMTLDELIKFIQQNPSVLKRPIVLNEDNFQVGYDAEEITALTPEHLRKLSSGFCNGNCQNYDVCGKVREADICDDCDSSKMIDSMPDMKLETK